AGGSGELHPELPLEAAGRSPIEGAAHVDQQPGIQPAVGRRFTNVGPVGASRDVPFDRAWVVARLVLTDVRVLDACPTEPRPLVTARMEAQTAKHRPARPAQELFDVNRTGREVRRQSGLR